MLADPLKYSDYSDRCSEFVNNAKINKKKWWHIVHNFSVHWQCVADFEELKTEIVKKLRKRSFYILDAWQDYHQYHEIVLKFQKILSEHYWKFDVVFIPEDDFVVISTYLTGQCDCLFTEAYWFEKEFGLKKKLNEDMFFEINVLEFIKFIYKQIQGT